MPPLLADFTPPRDYKPFCEKSLILPSGPIRLTGYSLPCHLCAPGMINTEHVLRAQKKTRLTSCLFLVRMMRLERTRRYDTRPSNVPVYRFQHIRKSGGPTRPPDYYSRPGGFCQLFFRRMPHMVQVTSCTVPPDVPAASPPLFSQCGIHRSARCRTGRRSPAGSWGGHPPGQSACG